MFFLEAIVSLNATAIVIKSNNFNRSSESGTILEQLDSCPVTGVHDRALSNMEKLRATLSRIGSKEVVDLHASSWVQRGCESSVVFAVNCRLAIVAVARDENKVVAD